MTDKIVRKDFAEELRERESCTKPQAKIVIDSMFSLLTQTLIDGHPFLIKGVGRLVPYYKQGGRPVRNPRNGEPFIMPDRLVVSLTSSNTIAKRPNLIEKAKMTNSGFITLLANRLSDLNFDNSLARALATTSVKLLHEIMQDAKSKLKTIEIRDFGSIRFRPLIKTSVRNPKTNEVVGRNIEFIRGTFRESTHLRRELNRKIELRENAG